MTVPGVARPAPTPPLRVLLGHVLRRHRTAQWSSWRTSSPAVLSPCRTPAPVATRQSASERPVIEDFVARHGSIVVKPARGEQGRDTGHRRREQPRLVRPHLPYIHSPAAGPNASPP